MPSTAIKEYAFSIPECHLSLNSQYIHVSYKKIVNKKMRPKWPIS